MFGFGTRRRGLFPWRLLTLASTGWYVYKMLKERQQQPQPKRPEETPADYDTIDEASWESFPASDPPSWSSSRS